MSENNTITSLEEKLNQLNSEINSLSGKCDLLQDQINRSDIKIVDLGRKKEIYKKSVEFLRLVEQSTKEGMKKGFEQIVTYALKFIYSDDYGFELCSDKRGNLQEIDFNIQTPDVKNPGDPLDTSGGGVLDIISVALRIALLELSKPKINGFLVLDESFKHLSAVYLPKACEFLKVISKKINRQIIMVTHQSIFTEIANNIIEIKKEKL